ncbi:MFS transporter [Microbacterium horticulturae]|uniref:MFS transporter n=1 Tax=Microbacterium horticulturae TaxID=3028316 RepID=A0ABY8BY25_9MICO|nr:MFS transporter [Microbacterium sp. KACC 23027]WEG09101.1 MFS transporter [Microbacterium sp. KACC 23027]
MTSATPPIHRDGAARAGLMLAGVLLLAANLRAGITSVGPVLGDIRTDLGIGGTAASFLVALPVIGFAVVSPIAPGIARKVGLERALGGSLLILAVAIVLRSVPLPGAIWVGTAILGGAIAMINVLLPALIKREYPDRVGPMTGIYSALQSGVAAIAAGLAVPIAGMTSAGWRLSLGIWAALALIAFAVFLPQLRARYTPADKAMDAAAAEGADAPADPAHVGPMWRSPLAWAVTLYLGLQSTIYYTAITWWPTVEHDGGLSIVGAGWHQFVFQCFGIVGSLTAAALLHRLRAQSGLAAIAAVVVFVAVGGQMLLPALGIVWVAMLGAAGGASITVALSLFGLRTRNHHQAAALSGMGQSVGYLLAAFGPILVGALHDATGSWEWPLFALLVVSVGIFITGILAGRARYVGERA